MLGHGHKFSPSAADRAWSLAVRNRDGNRCAVCGSRTHPQAHHIVSRQVLPTRWLPGQGITLCPNHHFFGALSAHRNPVWFLGWLRRHRPRQYGYVRRLQRAIEEYQAKVEAADRNYARRAGSTVWKSKRRRERE